VRVCRHAALALVALLAACADSSTSGEDITLSEPVGGFTEQDLRITVHPEGSGRLRIRWAAV
jgi:hypothetical protein